MCDVGGPEGPGERLGSPGVLDMQGRRGPFSEVNFLVAAVAPVVPSKLPTIVNIWGNPSLHGHTVRANTAPVRNDSIGNTVLFIDR